MCRPAAFFLWMLSSLVLSVHVSASEAFKTVPAIHVEGIEVAGNTVLSEEEIEAITHDYVGRELFIEELHMLRQQLSEKYLQAGYVNSGVTIPDQELNSGVVRLQVIEGELSEVVLNGNSALRSGYLEKQIRAGVSNPLNISDLQTSLKLLQEEPLISSVNARLVPGTTPGTSRLMVDVNETSPWELSISADNYRSPSVGEERGTLHFAHRSITGNNDALSARIGLTSGVNDYAFSYSLPLFRSATRFDAYYTDTDSEIVESPFDELDIESNVRAWGLAVSHPIIRDFSKRLSLRVGFENKRSESTLLGLPFSFSPGEVDGMAEGSSVFATAEWIHRFGSSVFAARGTLNLGTGWLDATKNNDPQVPDSKFTQFLGQINFSHRFPWRESRFIAKSTFQFASEPLLAMYRLPVGGRYTVRGYRETLLVRDEGATLSLEYRFPMFVNSEGRSRVALDLALFTDWGVSRNKEDTLLIQGTETIGSIGLGLLWKPMRGLTGEVYYGHALDDQDLPTDTLQDKGIHLQIAYSVNF